MVKRNNYPQEYKNKLSAEICAGTSPAVISKRENIGVQTLNKWKANYLSGADIEHMSKAEITEMRKNFLSFPCIYADAIKGLKETRLNQVIVGDVTQYCVNGKDFFSQLLWTDTIAR